AEHKVEVRSVWCGLRLYLIRETIDQPESSRAFPVRSRGCELFSPLADVADGCVDRCRPCEDLDCDRRLSVQWMAVLDGVVECFAAAEDVVVLELGTAARAGQPVLETATHLSQLGQVRGH